ncbi:hypothetical protein LZQ00_13165 [Sphingobacterium sp. SRCM116780]|uniref:VIT domain-containing protein n=1 Tax=Sphingobacterium sp. SRCM116780 TaxID=2907623 RepID=UPI001F2A8CCC|nr:VIT domain-containing protein [Sphingobacterium sp. SRCM116780]UIR55217.1 hypothetical protein LZQ00_13165 [Sphingobacterium sp. SRCM116780]
MKKLMLLLLILCLSQHDEIKSQENPTRPIPSLKISNDPKGQAKVGLQNLDIQVDIFGNIAKTTMTMTFHNDENRDLEGTLTFPMPEGVSVTGYAFDINGKLRQAVAVDKNKGTEIFESIESRRVDPGLLERVEGNNFKTRIYPLPAKGQRTISITYEENLQFHATTGFQYNLPLAYKQAIAQFKLQVNVYQSDKKPTFVSNPDASLSFSEENHMYQASINKTNFIPEKSLSIILPKQVNKNKILTQVNQDQSFYFLSNVFLEAPSKTKTWKNKIGIIWDNSLSAKDKDIQKELDLLDRIIQQKKDLTIELGLLNINYVKAKTFQIEQGNWTALKDYLLAITYDGGTDFSQLNEQVLQADEYLFFTEGLSTFGSNQVAIRKPIYCISSSAIADYSTLQAISKKTGGKTINLLKTNPADAVEQLGSENLKFLGIKEAMDFSEIYPAANTEVHEHIAITGLGKNKNLKQMTLQFGYGNQVTKEVKVDVNYQQNELDVHKIWAQQKIAALDVDYNQNKEQIEELGKQFGIVTRNTSLIVLETASDYVRYDIAPPAELLAEYNSLKKERNTLQEERVNDLLAQAELSVEQLKIWWNTDFSPKKHYPKPKKIIDEIAVEEMRPVADYTPPVANSQATEKESISMDAKKMESSDALQEVVVTGTLQGKVAGVSIANENTAINNASSRAKITIPEIKEDNVYLQALEKSAHPYQTYLELRPAYLGTPTFYFDVANFFYRKGMKDKALLVLSSLADLQIENADLFKTLAYKLKQWEQYKSEQYISKKILDWRPMDPQSHRDYALALQDNHHYQEAFEQLYSILTQSYSPEAANRDDGIEEIIVMELNNLLKLNKAAINANHTSKKLIADLPVDIRVVINWNSRNTDIDLWVTDPRDEKCFYSNNSTAIGGRLSNDFTGGYGPEQFLLKKAVKGKYKIEVDFYNNSELTLAGPAAVMAEIYLYYSSGRQERKIITIYLDKDKERNVTIGTFDF